MSSESSFRLCLTLVGCLALCGCGPSATGSADEEKEPQFLTGSNRVKTLDYQGAIEAFEQALEANPRSAAAHFELAWLFDEKEPDPATAIYHYQKYLKLRPGAGNAETVRGRVLVLKQELAKAAVTIPPSNEMQRRLDQLTEENRQLRDQLDRLRASPPSISPSNRVVAGSFAPANGASKSENVAARRPTTPAANPSRSEPTASATTRTHRVQAGETPMAIARRYHVKLDVLLTANPGLDPKRLRVGQSLVIPGR